MRILSRFSILVLALFLALAPTFAVAQTTGGGAGTTSGTTSGTTTTTTTTTGPNAGNINWTWIVVGAVVLVVIVGIVAMSNNRSRRD
jgi:hypothetical protein